jgi:hypothetical protein
MFRYTDQMGTNFTRWSCCKQLNRNAAGCCTGRHLEDEETSQIMSKIDTMRTLAESNPELFKQQQMNEVPLEKEGMMVKRGTYNLYSSFTTSLTLLLRTYCKELEAQVLPVVQRTTLLLRISKGIWFFLQFTIIHHLSINGNQTHCEHCMLRRSCREQHLLERFIWMDVKYQWITMETHHEFESTTK